MLSYLPFSVLESDVRDVLYLNWTIPIALAQSLSPSGVALMEKHGKTVFTILIYRHGHFGPRFLGPFRRFLPSPLQSNWRFYVTCIDQAPVPQPTVLFVRNFFDSALYAIGTRVGSDALPSELPKLFTYSTDGALRCQLIDADDELQLEASATTTEGKTLPSAFVDVFSSWDDAVSTLTQQDAAVVQPPDLDNLAHARISLPIDVASIKPAHADVTCGRWLARLGITGDPFAFIVPAVKFQVLSENMLTDRERAPNPRPGPV